MSNSKQIGYVVESGVKSPEYRCSGLVIPMGFEPMTHSLEGCSDAL